MPRLTKAAALAKAGYVPRKGRPRKYDEATVQISFRLTESQAERLGANRHQSARSIILKYLSGEISDPPKMPPDCDACPVIKCHGQTVYGGETCLVRVRNALRRDV